MLIKKLLSTLLAGCNATITASLPHLQLYLPEADRLHTIDPHNMEPLVEIGSPIVLVNAPELVSREHVKTEIFGMLAQRSGEICLFLFLPLRIVIRNMAIKHQIRNDTSSFHTSLTPR